MESHLQNDCWSLHFYHYAGVLRVGDKSHPFSQGSASLIPPRCEVEWRFPPHASHYYAHFKIVSKGHRVAMPVLRSPDAILPGFANRFDELVRFFSTGEHQRAQIRLWDLLFQIAEPIPAPPDSKHLHPNLQIALAVIRNSPGQKLTVHRLAAGMGISRNQLTRLFQKEFQCGAKEYIRRLRIARARDLLEHSALSLKTIAISCGFCDLSHFNKAIRATTGHSPTHHRQIHGSKKSNT